MRFRFVSLLALLMVMGNAVSLHAQGNKPQEPTASDTTPPATPPPTLKAPAGGPMPEERVLPVAPAEVKTSTLTIPSTGNAAGR